MTPPERKAFSSQLRRSGSAEVRQNTNATFQPDATKRSMAVTELERRRQADAREINSNPLRLLLLLIAFSTIVGATAYLFVL